MADLTALIRLHKHELDGKRAALAELYAAWEQWEQEQRDLARSIELEKKAADDAGGIHFTLLLYLEKTKRQQVELDGRGDLLKKRIDEAKDSLLETFGELKKYEMTQEERERLAAEERRLRENLEMDAIGLENFRRQGGE